MRIFELRSSMKRIAHEHREQIERGVVGTVRSELDTTEQPTTKQVIGVEDYEL